MRGNLFVHFFNWYLHETLLIFQGFFVEFPVFNLICIIGLGLTNLSKGLVHIKDSKIFQPLAHTTNIGKILMISVQKSRPELSSTVKAISCIKTDHTFWSGA